jgi:cellulose synthase operon protein C
MDVSKEELEGLEQGGDRPTTPHPRSQPPDGGRASGSPGSYSLTRPPGVPRGSWPPDRLKTTAFGSIMMEGLTASERPPPESLTPDVELKARADRLKGPDPVGSARALVELGIYEERVRGDRAAARAHYEAARALVRTLQPALCRVRRLLTGKNELAHLLATVDDELAVAEADAVRADLLAERARCYVAMDCLAEARASFEESLRLSPQHAASLRGLEATLRREIATGTAKGLAQNLAQHLERTADAYAPASGRLDGDSRLAAWIHVERAELLDGLRQADDAQGALERAVSLAPAPGPVRDALVRHLVHHGKDPPLVPALCVEADQEPDDDRASRLFYTAARIVIDKLRAPTDAIMILSRASARAPATTPTSRRTLTELIAQLEVTGNLESAAAVRQKRLPLLTEKEQIAHEHVRLSEVYTTLGRADQAVEAAARALAENPRDSATRERLDRALQRLGHHKERVRLWLTEANSDRPTEIRVEAYLKAADIALRHLRRTDDALAHLRAAWTIDHESGVVFDALSGLLAPPPRDAESDVRGVRERIELYGMAAHSARDPARKIGFYDKLASIWEDELSQPARAIEEIEKILEIDPTRRTAILALQRNAERAGDNKRLAEALRVEADLTKDPDLARRLLLRAAEVLSDRVGDHDRATELVQRALAIDERDPRALRRLFRLQERTNRYDEARQTLRRRIDVDPGGDEAFGLWIEMARLDEQHRKRPHDAVDAYQRAAKVKPLHPLPPLEIVRLLREVADFPRLCKALISLADDVAEADERTRLLVQAAEVQERCMSDDDSALKSFERADEEAQLGTPDPSIVEAMERILIRKDKRVALTALYAKWLERQPGAAIDHGLRLKLAGVLSRTDKRQAVDILSALVEVVPDHVPALRRLEQLHRELGDHGGLATVLTAEAQVFASNLSRCGALWELVTLEERLGAAATLDALARLMVDSPRDTSALETIIRIGGRIAGDQTALHPAAAPTRKQLTEALRARKELTADPHARAAYQIEEALLYEVEAESDAAAAHAALGGFLEALSLWPESLLAARGLDRMASLLGDRTSMVRAQLALAKLVQYKSLKAQHLVHAAEIAAQLGEPAELPKCLDLYEEALKTDAENDAAAASLIRILARDPVRLCARLGDALERAKRDDRVVHLGVAIGRAALGARDAGGAAIAQSHPDVPTDISAVIRGDQDAVTDFGVGIAAMRRVLAVVPDDIEATLLMAKLLAAQQVWAEARDMLVRVVDLATAPQVRVSAHFSLAQLYEGPLADLELAETALVPALAIEPQNKHALERLYKVAQKREDKALVISVLERLAEYEVDSEARAEYDLRLAEACREADDQVGVVRALCDAVVSAPKDMRGWNLLAQVFRLETPEGAASYARALHQVLEIATQRRLTIEPRWLLTLGLIEVNLLRRPGDGVAHLQRATGLGAPPETRVALGQGLVAAGRNAEAAKTLRDLLTTEGEMLLRLAEPPAFAGIRAASVAPAGTVLAAALACLESALATEGRAEERLAVEEVRACLGEVSAERVSALRSRRLKPEAPYPGALAGSEFARLLVPEARSPLIDVAVALAPVAAKALRIELSNIGVASRERIGPRDGHPTRYLAERLGRCIGVEEFELYLSSAWQGGARVFPGDPPAIVATTSFPDLPEPEQIFALSHLLTRIALGVTWLDELTVEAADGFFIAALRTAEPLFGVNEIAAPREQATQNFIAPVQRAVGRRQRKLLEEILPNASCNYDARAFLIGVRRSEYRSAYVMTGDLVCSVDYVRRFDRELARAAEAPRVLLQHPVTNELLRFAMTPEAFSERRRLGTIWGG